MYPRSDPEGTDHPLIANSIITIDDLPCFSRAQGSIPGTRGEREPTLMLGNPYAMRVVSDKLDQALARAIIAVEGEEKSTGASGNEIRTVQKLKSWQMGSA